MKLYIPTCTLNFNNIFSTESISPSSYYQKRDFGNKRFYSVKSNNIDDAIVLYSKFPRYSVDNLDIENSPMVIEVETDDYSEEFFLKVSEKEDVEVFLCQHTIYLNPFHSFVYFDSYESRQGVLTKAEQSLENKFSKLYSANLLVKTESKKNLFDKTLDFFSQTESDDFSWSSSYLNFDVPELISDYQKDITIDRLKGFLYSYLIGANQSVSSETGQLKSIARNLRNILSAVVNSPEKKPTTHQDEALVEGIKEFNRIYSLKDEDSIWNRNSLKEHLSTNPIGASIEDCVKLLKAWNLFDVYCTRIQLRKTYDANELWTCLEYANSDAFNRVIGNLQYAVKKIEHYDLASREKKSIGSLIKIEDGSSVTMVDPSFKHNFYQELIQSQIRAEHLKIMEENGVEEPLALAFNGGGILKRIMGDKWETSDVSTYVNSLLSHFQENTSFDLFSIDSDVVTSFAAFCQKGDNIDRLSEYLVQCGFSNYKLAYGIYGATRGFASLPKTFTSSLINGEREYYKVTYLNIHEQLFGTIIVNAELPLPKQGNQTNVFTSEIGSKIISNISKIEPKPAKQTNVVNAVSQAVNLEDAVQSPRAFMYIYDSFKGIKNTKAYKNLLAANFENDNGVYTPENFKSKIYQIIGKDGLKSQKEKIDKAIELEAKRQDSEAFLRILDNFLKPTDTAYKKIASLLSNASISQHVVSSENKKTDFQNTSTYTIGKIFVSDKNCWKFLQNNIPQAYRQEFIQDLNWFQDEYAKGDASRYYAHASHENSATILAFIRYISKKKYAGALRLDEIETYLRRIYVR